MSFNLVSKAIHAKGLTSTEKLVLIALCDFADDKKYQSYPSHETIADICCYNKTTIIRAINSLCEKGFVKKKKRKNNGGDTSNLYTVLHKNFKLLGGDSVPPPPVAQCNPPSDSVPPKPITEPIIINQSLNQSNIRKKKSEKNNDDYSEDFEEFWQQYPKKQGKHAAFKAYQKAIKKTDKQKILSGAIFYNSQIHQKQTPEQYIKQASGWLNDQRYNDIPISTTETRANHAEHHSSVKQDSYSIALSNLEQRIRDYEGEDWEN